MDNAILMASGMGTRMYPLTKFTPKPLVRVGNKPMVETIISGLEKRGVENIVVVTGYLGEQFNYLTKKYNNVTIIYNKVYETINNISSIFAAKETLLEGNCFICETDLYVSDETIFLPKFDMSCYYGKMVKGHSEDWVFEQNEKGIITRVGKIGDNCYNMAGIAYFKEADAKALYKAIVEEYGAPGYESMFWDDVVNIHINEFKLTVYPVDNGQVIEIDTVAELEELQEKLWLRR